MIFHCTFIVLALSKSVSEIMWLTYVNLIFSSRHFLRDNSAFLSSDFRARWEIREFLDPIQIFDRSVLQNIQRIGQELSGRVGADGADVLLPVVRNEFLDLLHALHRTGIAEDGVDQTQMFGPEGLAEPRNFHYFT